MTIYFCDDDLIRSIVPIVGPLKKQRRRPFSGGSLIARLLKINPLRRVTRATDNKVLAGITIDRTKDRIIQTGETERAPSIIAAAIFSKQVVPRSRAKITATGEFIAWTRRAGPSRRRGPVDCHLDGRHGLYGLIRPTRLHPRSVSRARARALMRVAGIFVVKVSRCCDSDYRGEDG